MTWRRLPMRKAVTTPCRSPWSWKGSGWADPEAPPPLPRVTLSLPAFTGQPCPACSPSASLLAHIKGKFCCYLGPVFIHMWKHTCQSFLMWWLSSFLFFWWLLLLIIIVINNNNSNNFFHLIIETVLLGHFIWCKLVFSPAPLNKYSRNPDFNAVFIKATPGQTGESVSQNTVSVTHLSLWSCDVAVFLAGLELYIIWFSNCSSCCH